MGAINRGSNNLCDEKFALREQILPRSPIIPPILAAFLSVLLFAGCSVSRTGQMLNVGVVASSTADYVTTRQGISRGARELNPILGNGALRQFALKSLGAGVVIGSAQVIELKGKPVLAHIVRAVVMAGYTWASIHNHGVSR